MDIASACRTCMKDNVNLVDLYVTVEVEEMNCRIQLLDMLKECTTAQVSKEDGLPKYVCDECSKIIHISYTFRNQALRVEKEFKRLILLQSTVKSEEIDFKPKTEQDEDYFDYTDDLDFESFPKQEPQTCLDTFDADTLLLKHMVTNTEDVQVKSEFGDSQQKFQCPECDVSFVKSRSLSMHMKKHRGKNKVSDGTQFICDVCGKKFQLKSHLRRHMKLHSDVRPYKCTKCPKKYSRQDQLTDHLNKHNGIKPNICSYCKKGFSQSCSLKDHIRTHTGETPYLCSQCGKGFSNSSNLRQHMMRHSGLKPYACNMCPKAFCTKGQLTSHSTTHTGAQPYKCAECGAAFTKPNSLKKHSFIHLGLRPYACDNCNMRFTCKDHLKRHYRIHTGEKPYRCNFCERAFTQSNDLVKHTRSHIGQNIYQCTVCGQKFRLATELKLHYPVHFNGNHPPSEQKDPEPEPPGSELKASDVKTDGRFTITINGCDENGVVGDITINISPEKS